MSAQRLANNRVVASPRGITQTQLCPILQYTVIGHRWICSQGPLFVQTVGYNLGVRQHANMPPSSVSPFLSNGSACKGFPCDQWWLLCPAAVIQRAFSTGSVYSVMLLSWLMTLSQFCCITDLPEPNLKTTTKQDRIP